MIAQSRFKSVCVFCGSRPGAHPQYAEHARALGAALAHRGQRLVYGGGELGLMGIVADAALACGGSVLGIIPEFLTEFEAAHTRVQDLRIVPSMHVRKHMMLEESDAIIMLPGGIGTLEEFFEVFSWFYLGVHAKPIGILNVGGFFDPLLALLWHTVQGGFVNAGTVELLVVAQETSKLLDELEKFIPPQQTGAVLSRAQT